MWDRRRSISCSCRCYCVAQKHQHPSICNMRIARCSRFCLHPLEVPIPMWVGGSHCRSTWETIETKKLKKKFMKKTRSKKKKKKNRKRGVDRRRRKEMRLEMEITSRQRVLEWTTAQRKSKRWVRDLKVVLSVGIYIRLKWQRIGKSLRFC